MNDLEKFTEGMVERLRAEIEEYAKGLIYVPVQTFPITQTFENDAEKITVTYNKPDKNGSISCDVTRECKVITIQVSY